MKKKKKKDEAAFAWFYGSWVYGKPQNQKTPNGIKKGGGGHPQLIIHGVVAQLELVLLFPMQ